MATLASASESAKGGRQGLDDFFGNIEPRADPYDVLHDQIVLFRLGKLLDRLIGLLDDRGVFLVLAQVEIFTEFALFPLEFARQLVEFLFLGTPIRLGHGKGVLLQSLLHSLQLLRHALKILIAFREFGFDLLGCFDGSRCVAEDPMGVDVTDLERIRCGGIGYGKHGHQRDQQGGNFLVQADFSCLKSLSHLELEFLKFITILLVERLGNTEFKRAER